MVARARGAKVSDGIVSQSLASLDRAPATAIGNMRDIVDGRLSELETEVGAIVRLARDLRIEVPRHVFLYASLLPQERKARGEIQFPVPTSKTTRAA
jgi:2-dehydropantoate 2-reductase